MKIFIPTRGRTVRQYTWDALPDRIKKFTCLVCPKEELARHKEAGRRAISCPVEGIILKRQWIFDTFKSEDYIFMLDDDLQFSKRISQQDYHLLGATELEMMELFRRCLSLLKEYPQVGVSQRNGNNRFFPQMKVDCNRVTNFHAYEMETIRRLGLRFHDKRLPSTFTMEDFHITLSLLTAGFPNAIVTDYAWGQVGSNSAGGCSTYRTAETQRRSALLLAELYPGLVRVREKKTKSWKGVSDEDGVRTDVVIFWKKAFKQGLKK